MRKKISIVKIAVMLLVVLLLILVSLMCNHQNQSGSTIDEPDITVDYLENEYAQQLVRDGAVEIFGTVDITVLENKTIQLNIEEKEFVKDENYPNDYYIADKNQSATAYLPEEARTTFLAGESSTPVILLAADFVEAANKDAAEYGKDNPLYKDGKLYTIYVMDNQVVLLLAKYLP